jgi:hypothetical protein
VNVIDVDEDLLVNAIGVDEDFLVNAIDVDEDFRVNAIGVDEDFPVMMMVIWSSPFFLLFEQLMHPVELFVIQLAVESHFLW